MKKLKSIKLNKLATSEVNSLQMKRIIGGACTDYSCDCSNPNLASSYVDGSLDATARAGYLPKM